MAIYLLQDTCFKIRPDQIAENTENAAPGDYLSGNPISTTLDSSESRNSAKDDRMVGLIKLDFCSTLGTGTMALMSTWARECATSLKQCLKILLSNDTSQHEGALCLDRLISINRLELNDTMYTIIARIVLKSDARDISPEKGAARIKHFSLSHCRGPPPDPSGELQGREETVLSKTTLPLWPEDLPLDNLPLVFQHAVRICLSLGFEYIWFDGLCFFQESLKDWQTQSAAMGSVYKYAWLNTGFFPARSDHERSINDTGDPRVEFGFRSPYASFLDRDLEQKSSGGKTCVLLQGKARLHWNFSPHTQGTIFSTRPYLSEAGCTNHVTSLAVH